MSLRISKQMLVTGFVGIAAVFLLGGLTQAWAADEAHGFVGVKKCKMCHKKEEQGAQYKQWLDTKHAKAYETLASEESLEIAKAKGIENPQTAAECLECHVTAFPVMGDLANQKITLEEGVSCESCHGAGADYYKKKTMKAISAGEVDGAELGLMAPTEETCTGCHNEKSPTFESFDFEEMFEKVKHPTPDAAG